MIRARPRYPRSINPYTDLKTALEPEEELKISATIIVHNEETNVAAVCETVSWADEIVIVDSDSTDRTVEIARRYTDKVFNRPFRRYKTKPQFAYSPTPSHSIFYI